MLGEFGCERGKSDGEEKGGERRREEERRGRTMSDEFKNIKHLEKILLIGCITGVYLQSKHRER